MGMQPVHVAWRQGFTDAAWQTPAEAGEAYFIEVRTVVFGKPLVYHRFYKYDMPPFREIADQLRQMKDVTVVTGRIKCKRGPIRFRPSSFA